VGVGDGVSVRVGVGVSDGVKVGRSVGVGSGEDACGKLMARHTFQPSNPRTAMRPTSIPNSIRR